jgi:hypothetical protein
MVNLHYLVEKYYDYRQHTTKTWSVNDVKLTLWDRTRVRTKIVACIANLLMKSLDTIPKEEQRNWEFVKKVIDEPSFDPRNYSYFESILTEPPFRIKDLSKSERETKHIADILKETSSKDAEQFGADIKVKIMKIEKKQKVLRDLKKTLD